MADTPESTSITRIAVEAFAGQCRRHLTPITGAISGFEAVSLDSEQQRQFLREPAEAIPQSLLARLPPLRIILVPYLEKGQEGGTDFVAFEKPPAQGLLSSSTFDVHDEIFLFFGIEQQDVADYHYWLFQATAGLGSKALGEDEVSAFSTLVFDELSRGTRGEADELSLQLKLKLQRRQHMPGRTTKLMREYILQAIQDTLTLYLHGLCCDIDVDPNPRQLGTPYLRRRLELLSEIYPPNPGYLVFPAAPPPEPPPQESAES
jgi:hypothetical protein